MKDVIAIQHSLTGYIPLTGAPSASQGHSLFILPTVVREASENIHQIMWFPSLHPPVVTHTMQNKIKILFIDSVSCMVWLLIISLIAFLITLSLVPFTPVTVASVMLQAYLFLRLYYVFLCLDRFFSWCSLASLPHLLHSCLRSNVISSEMPLLINLRQHSIFTLS